VRRERKPGERVDRDQGRIVRQQHRLARGEQQDVAMDAGHVYSIAADRPF
jgi:hypothetical protein